MRDNSSLNSIFNKLSTLSAFSKSALMQMPIVSSSGMLVKKNQHLGFP